MFLCGNGALQRLEDTIYINQLYFLHFFKKLYLDWKDPSFQLKAKVENAKFPSDMVPSFFSRLLITESLTVSLRVMADW